MLAKRVAKANRLLSCLADFEDAQGALHLVRNCASWCKVVYACRTVPPNLQTHALSNFTANLRNTLNTIVRESVDDRSWCLAQLGISYGGLRQKDAVKHASGAYVASVLQAGHICTRIDPSFDASDTCGGLCLREAETMLRDCVLETNSWNRPDYAPSQRELSGMIDEAIRHKLRVDQAHDALF